MKRFSFLIALFIITSLSANAQKIDDSCRQVLLETNFGDVKLLLYNETPKHRDNFIKLVEEGFYDGVLFHRVINNFMVQAGDSASRHAQPGERLGGGEDKYTIPAEIIPGFYHKRGSLAAAREGDFVNPQRRSSMSQFYIVTRNLCPHLDGSYTIFGEVIDGMGYVLDMQQTQTDAFDRPVEDMRIIKATVIK